MTRMVRLLFVVLLLLALSGSRCTVGEAGAPPQQHNPQDRDLYLLSESSARTAHVYIAIDGRKMIDGEQPMPSRIHLTLHADEFLSFEVIAVRYPSTVRCAIMGADGRIVDQYPRPGQRPTQHAICGLAALREKA